jgi:excisionase family DNA binding protein
MTVLRNVGEPTHQERSFAIAFRKAGGEQRDGTEGRRSLDKDTTTLLTAAQIAERWQVPVRTIYAWARRNAIPHYRAGRLLRFDPAEVEDHFRSGGYTEEVNPDNEHPGESAFALLTA